MPNSTQHDFASKWKRVTVQEKQTHQKHFIDLYRPVKQQTRKGYDPTSTRFGFETGAARTGSGHGWLSDLGEGEIRWLLALNLERASRADES